LRARTLTLKVKYSDFQIITRSRTEASAIVGREDLDSIALALLEPLFPLEKSIRLLGVALSSLETSQGDDRQLTLEL
jgi:DNA polymerase-4